MKKRNKKMNRYIGVALLATVFMACVFSIMPTRTMAQTDTAADTKEVSKLSPAIEFVCIQKNDNSIDLKAKLTVKVKKVITKLFGLTVSFFTTDETGEKKLGDAMTDFSGNAILNVKSDQLVKDKDGKVNFKVVFAGDKEYESAEEVVGIKRARLDIIPVKEDSTYTVKVKLVDLSTGAEMNVPEIDFGVFVKRMFSPFKLGEGKTDSSGEVSVEIPANLPGDAKGNITLLAQINEHADYGNLEAITVQPWGKPVSDSVTDLPRALWSPHPPVWMIITFVVLMVVVWGHYLVIVVQLFRLKKEHVNPAS